MPSRSSVSRCAGERRGHIRSSVASGAAAMPTSAAIARGTRQRGQQHEPAADARADEDLRPLASARREPRPHHRASGRSSPRRRRRTRRRGRNNRSAGRPGRASRQNASSIVALVPVMSDMKPPRKTTPGLLAGRGDVGDCRAVLACYICRVARAAPDGVAIGSISASAIMTIDADPSILAAHAEGRPPRVLQVLPRWSAAASSAAPSRSPRPSPRPAGAPTSPRAGGKMVHEITRHGGQHITLPLASKNPLVMRRNVRRLVKRHPVAQHRHRPCPQPRPGLERLVGDAAHRHAFRHHLPQRLRLGYAAAALVQLGDGPRRARRRHLAIRRRARGRDLWHCAGAAARHRARRRSRALRSAARQPGADHPAGPGVAPAGRPAGRHAARPADALEGPARPRRRDRARSAASISAACSSAPTTGAARFRHEVEREIVTRGLDGVV